MKTELKIISKNSIEKNIKIQMNLKHTAKKTKMILLLQLK